MVQAMSSLESSLEKFLDALGELERAVDGRLAGDVERPDAGELADELQGLRADRASLAGELERLKSENRTLEALTDDVNLRLDGAIEEIRGALE